MSSVALRASENYIKLILETDKKQAKLLISSPTNVQVKALTEIAFNLLYQSIPNKYKRLVNKSKKFLKKLAKIGGSIKTKLSLIKKNSETILKLLLLIKDSLLELLS